MADETTVPLFPCGPLGPTLDFYRALGFEVTHEQERPYVYAAVRRGAIDLHFHGTARVDPAKSSNSCLIFVPGVGGYHRAFADGLRRGFGKVPTAGFPRITRLGAGRTRFSAFDPSGNTLVFINRDEPDIDYDAYEPAGSKLGEAIDKAAFLRDTYTDDPAAARVLDKALARETSAAPIDRARALAARAELAVALGDSDRARSLRDELRQIPLSDEQRDQYRDELQAADLLERWIHEPDPAGTP